MLQTGPRNDVDTLNRREIKLTEKITLLIQYIKVINLKLARHVQVNKFNVFKFQSLHFLTIQINIFSYSMLNENKIS